MESTGAHVRKSKTLFIRNLPFSTTNDKLEDAFSDIGPIKQCFVVKNKDSEKCKGYGYVTFSLFDDAEKAKEKIKSLDGRKLYISYADRKKDEKKKKKAKISNDTEDLAEESEVEEKTEDKPEPKQDNPTIKSHQESKYLQAKTLVVTGFKEDCSTDTLKNCLQKLNVKNVAKFDFPVSGRDVPTAFVRFKCVRDTKRGQRRLEGSDYKGMKLKAVQLNKETIVVPQKELKKARIIIRNLSFKCTDDLLEKTFRKFGNISEVKIPQKPDGRMFGFGFVQFTDVSAASRAIQQINTKPILGRPVAVDWAVPKDKFQAATSTTSPVSNNSEDSESDEGSFSADSEGTSEEESGDTEGDDDENDSSDEGFDDRNSSSDNSDDEDESDEEGDEGSDISDDEEDMVGKTKAKRIKNKTSRKSDVEEGRTLFIRNLSYDTEEDVLSESLSKYGKVTYCRLVVDKNTEHPKGTAFVQFMKKEDADKCLQEANDELQDGGIKLDGRKLSITVAVNRDTAIKFNEKKDKEKIDRRNLHLAREGIIRAGTQAAQGLSKDDLAKRMKVEMLKRQKLKNPNIFVSSTRLCVRNLPTSVDEKQLKKIYLKAADSKTAVITECRIMRDQARVSGQGVAKSRGFGFINFTDHQDALQALRYTNNNPDLFGEKKRLIVEFSLENKAALVAKDKRMERIKARQESLKKNKNEEISKKDKVKNKNKKQSLSDKFIGQTVITKEEGKNVPKTLSSHWGPKIRHKKRLSQIENEKKQKKRKNNKNFQEKKRKITDNISVVHSTEFERPSKKKKKQKETKDAFDDLVSNYKKKIMNAQTTHKKSKWFS